MRIFITPGGPTDSSAYLAEILHAFGLFSLERSSSENALRIAHPHRDLIVLSRGSEASGVESFLQAGGSVLAILPSDSIERLAGLVRKREEQGPARLRFAQPVSYGVRGEPLWTVGPVRFFEPKPGANVVAYLYKPDDPPAESVGIWECAVGSGRLIIYAYDPAACIARLRQGDPARANYLPPGQKTPRATFLHPPNPPLDTYWKPTADLHAMALVELIQRLLRRHAPVPTLWHLPDGKPSILLFSGDEDNSPQEANDAEMRDLESVGGAMNLYIIPDITSITRDLIEKYTRRGHAMSVHPNLTDYAGQPPAAQLAQAERQVRMFREKFQWPARTVRDHCYMWPGYVELPELWERLGIGMDLNTTATLYGSSLDYGPYVNVHAGVPLRFVRENGSLIDVFQQPTHINDDLEAHPSKDWALKSSGESYEWVAQRILEEAARFYHAPVCANVHPVNYVKFSGPHGRVLMARARELGLPIWSLDRWHDWWRARSTWRMMSSDNREGQVRWIFKGDPCSGLAIRVSTERAITDVRVNGAPSETKCVRLNGRDAVEVPVPDNATECAVSARASGHA